ncbi:hypothetical protein F5890DRAFT_1479432, partial [Lentinula detonsa]
MSGYKLDISKSMGRQALQSGYYLDQSRPLKLRSTLDFATVTPNYFHPTLLCPVINQIGVTRGSRAHVCEVMDPKNLQSSPEELQPDEGKSVAHKNRFQIGRDLFFACKDYVLKDDRLRNILLDAGTLSYLIYTFKLLLKFSMMFRSQPHAVTVGFTVPSVVIYAFIQRYAPCKLEETKSTTLQAAVDVTILAALTSNEEIYSILLPFMVIYLRLKHTGQDLLLATVMRIPLIYDDVETLFSGSVNKLSILRWAYSHSSRERYHLQKHFHNPTCSRPRLPPSHRSTAESEVRS